MVNDLFQSRLPTVFRPGFKKMNTFAKIAAAALAACLISAGAEAGQKPFSGVVIVPAAAPATEQVELKIRAPGLKRGKIVAFSSSKKAGSIIISSKKNELYYVLGNGQAVKYRVATAKRGFEWRGTHKVSYKTQWPDWRPPTEMRKRRPDLPVFMAGGPENPLGARALYLGASIYRIHGTNEPKSIGKAASSGCIRMLNEDVTELYTLVKVGAEVTVL
jgi:lipoprotein-anchoring transpeptidase ErfK/SrfK